jgi:hypothetical protein
MLDIYIPFCAQVTAIMVDFTRQVGLFYSVYDVFVLYFNAIHAKQHMNQSRARGKVPDWDFDANHAFSQTITVSLVRSVTLS